MGERRWVSKFGSGEEDVEDIEDEWGWEFVGDSEGEWWGKEGKLDDWVPSYEVWSFLEDMKKFFRRLGWMGMSEAGEV